MAFVRYFKVTDQQETHFGHKYCTGLNVLVEPFNEKSGLCVGSGLYYTDLEHIHEFYPLGIYLREVFLPTHDPEFRVVADGNNKWRANKIILGERYSLFDQSTYIKFELDINQNITIADKASAYGNIDFLNWWLESPLIKVKHYSQNAMDLASRNNHRNVLDWWLKNFPHALKYSEYALDWASEYGHDQILDWWFKSGLDVRYFAYAMDKASSNGFVHILQKWKESGHKLLYTGDVCDIAMRTGKIDVANWWCTSGLVNVRFSADSINLLFGTYPFVLITDVEPDIYSEYSVSYRIINCPTSNGNIHMLGSWIWRLDLPIKNRDLKIWRRENGLFINKPSGQAYSVYDLDFLREMQPVMMGIQNIAEKINDAYTDPGSEFHIFHTKSKLSLDNFRRAIISSATKY